MRMEGLSGGIWTFLVMDVIVAYILPAVERLQPWITTVVEV